MAVTVEALAAELGVKDESQLAKVLAEAVLLVGKLTAGSTTPPEMVDRAVTLTAGDLWHLRSAPNGVRSFQDPNGAQAVRVNRDPTTRARGVLAPWLTPGIA